MEENCHVEPVYKETVPVGKLKNADRATLLVADAEGRGAVRQNPLTVLELGALLADAAVG